MGTANIEIIIASEKDNLLQKMKARILNKKKCVLKETLDIFHQDLNLQY